MTARKYTANIPVNRQWLAFRYGGEWLRKVATRTETPPTEQDWAEYHEGVALLDKLRANRYFDEGGDEYGATMSEPQPTVHIEYAETEDEWTARIAELDIDEAERTYVDPIAAFIDRVSHRLLHIAAEDPHA